MSAARLGMVVGALSVLGCFHPTPVGDAASPIVLAEGAAPVQVGTAAALAVDVDPALSLEDVLAAEVPFARYDTPRPTFRRGEGTLWLDLAVEVPAGGTHEPWVLAFHHPRPRGVWVHWTDEAGHLRAKEAGLRLPSAEHDVPSRAVALRLPLPAQGPRRFLVRVDAFPLGVSAEVLPESAHHAAERLGALVQGLHYGEALGLVAFNLVLFALLRRRGFVLFAAYGLLQAAFFFARNGWLWHLGLWTAGGRNVGGLLTSLHVAVLLQLTAEVLGTRAAAPRLHRAVRWGTGLALLNAALSVAGLGRWTDALGIQLGFAATLFVVGAAAWQLSRGTPGAGAYLAGHGAYLAGALLYVFKSFGWVEHTPLTEHAMQVGSALNLALSALALVAHVRALELSQREAAQALSLLEARRTAELEQLRAEGLARALAAQDAERERVARELHDGLGHHLLALKTTLADGPAAAKKLADESLGLVRDVSRDLYPASLATLGLTRALQDAAERSVQGTTVQLALAVTPIDDAVRREAWPTVLRLVQEALRNALTHGRPRSLSLEAAREGDAVVIAVGDDGAGFDVGATAPGSGLRNLADRAAHAGGTLAVDSAPGEGTRVELRLPVG